MFRISQSRATNPLLGSGFFQIAFTQGVYLLLALRVAPTVAGVVAPLFVELELLASALGEGLEGKVDVVHVCFLSFSRS